MSVAVLLHVCLCTTCGGQRWTPDTPGLDLHRGMSCHTGSGNQTWVLWMSDRCFKPGAILPWPVLDFSCYTSHTVQHWDEQLQSSGTYYAISAAVAQPFCSSFKILPFIYLCHFFTQSVLKVF